MQRRVCFPLRWRPGRWRPGLWPLLSLLACGDEASPSSEPAPGAEHASSRPAGSRLQPVAGPALGAPEPEPSPQSPARGAGAEPFAPGAAPDAAELPGGAQVELDVIAGDGSGVGGEPVPASSGDQSPTPPDAGAPDVEVPEPLTPGPPPAGAGGGGGGTGESGEGAGGAASTPSSDAGAGAPPAGSAGSEGAAGSSPDAPPPVEEEPGEAEEEEEEPPLQASFHLAVIGSSTAAGEGASTRESGWVPLLAAELAGVAAFSVSNFAVPGYTSVELLPASRQGGNIEEAIAAQPDLILVALAGSNDLSAGTSTSTFFERLHALRDSARAANIPVFFVSTAPKDISEPERETLADWAEQMRAAYETCWVPGSDQEAGYAACFVDIFTALASSSLGLLPQYSSGDGIHLNDAGHAQVFRKTDAVLRPYVCGVTRCRPPDPDSE